MANTDHYLPCDQYESGQASAEHPGFRTFQHPDDQQFYFALTDGAGNVLLRSEGYTTANARDKGIESVIRNRDTEERYAVVEEDGSFFIVLKSGNHQEIARSCPFENESAAVGIISRSFAPAAERLVKVEDYLPCKDYVGHLFDPEHPGFTTFDDPATGKHYFAMLDGHGSVLLRSEGYNSVAARNKGMESVLKNRDAEERYAIFEEEGMWFVSLKASNGQEIARSCGLGSHAAAESILLHCYSRQHLEQIAVGADEIVEDYLPCAAYTGKSSSEIAGFTVFQDPQSHLHYFAMVDEQGDVVLRSEGYKDATRRDNGIESVIRNRGIADHWLALQDEHGYYMSLRAVNHQEIARSCHFKDEASMNAWFTPFMAEHGGWANDAEPEDKEALAAMAANALSGATPAPVMPELSRQSLHPTSPVGQEEEDTGSWWKWVVMAIVLLVIVWFWLRK